MSRFPAIPDFEDGDARSMAIALRAMKDIIEQLSGLRRDRPAAPVLYLREKAPENIVDGRLEIGMLWIKPSTDSLAWYNGTEWVVLV